jgi:hypothetical protein
MPRNEEPFSELKQKRTERAATRRLAWGKEKIGIHTPFATEVIPLYQGGRNQRGKLFSQLGFFGANTATTTNPPNVEVSYRFLHRTAKPHVERFRALSVRVGVAGTGVRNFDGEI